MKDSKHVNIHSVNPLNIIINEADGSIECNSIEKENGNKYLTFASTNKKKVLEKYAELLNKIKSLIEFNSIEKPGKYQKYYMKIKFSSDNNQPLNKILKLQNLTIIVRSVPDEDRKYYPQVFLDEFLHEL